MYMDTQGMQWLGNDKTIIYFSQKKEFKDRSEMYTRCWLDIPNWKLFVYLGHTLSDENMMLGMASQQRRHRPRFFDTVVIISEHGYIVGTLIEMVIPLASIFKWDGFKIEFVPHGVPQTGNKILLIKIMPCN